jgi:hypothetical protein
VPIKALDAQAICRRCDPALLPSQTTAELAAETGIVGQAPAVDAVQFGIDIKQPGCHLFVRGEPGSGRHPLVRRLLEAKAIEGQVPGKGGKP